MERSIGRKLKALGCVCVLIAIMFMGYNLYDSERAGKISDEILLQLEEDMLVGEFQDTVEGMEMPVVVVENQLFIGSLEIPSIGVELPIASECNTETLRNSPCRYVGSVYDNDLIIAGHNYMKHFSKIKKMIYGDEFRFTDADGKVYEYLVIGVEILEENKVQDLKSGEWDITLFTCTTTRDKRFVVRGKLK